MVHDPLHLVRVETVSESPDDGLVLVDLTVEVDADLWIEPWDKTPFADLSATQTLTFSCTATYDLGSETLDNLTIGTISIDVDSIIERDSFITTYDRPLPLVIQSSYPGSRISR